jgi:alpha-N-acetylglucosamine transferase
MNKQVIIEKLRKFFGAAGKTVVIVSAMLVGFGVSEALNAYKKNREKEVSVMPPTRSIEYTSIATNERGELLVIDRKTGEYTVYSDSIGTAIFNLYAGRIYANMNSK